MIQTFVNAFMERQDKLRQEFSAKHPENYESIVRSVVSLLSDVEQDFGRMDPERIHEINDGDYQGTLLYLIAADDYQPSRYWYVRVSYGSCSGCDTLESIRSYDDGTPSEQQVSDYLTLALHIVQGLKELPESDISE